MTQTALDVEIIRQYPGPVQVARRVQLKVPGKHFSNLTAAEQKELYDGTAVEYAERHKFAQHLKAWGVWQVHGRGQHAAAPATCCCAAW